VVGRWSAVGGWLLVVGGWRLVGVVGGWHVVGGWWFAVVGAQRFRERARGADQPGTVAVKQEGQHDSSDRPPGGQCWPLAGVCCLWCLQESFVGGQWWMVAVSVGKTGTVYGPDATLKLSHWARTEMAALVINLYLFVINSQLKLQIVVLSLLQNVGPKCPYVRANRSSAIRY
jgi:hypothetical protein